MSLIPLVGTVYFFLVVYTTNLSQSFTFNPKKFRTLNMPDIIIKKITANKKEHLKAELSIGHCCY